MEYGPTTLKNWTVDVWEDNDKNTIHDYVTYAAEEWSEKRSFLETEFLVILPQLR